MNACLIRRAIGARDPEQDSPQQDHFFKCTAIPAQISDRPTSVYLFPLIFREISLARSVFCVYLFLSSSSFMFQINLNKLIEIAEALRGLSVPCSMQHSVLHSLWAFGFREIRPADIAPSSVSRMLSPRLSLAFAPAVNSLSPLIQFRIR